MFTHRRSTDPPTYHYHALFRAFLQDEAQRSLQESERKLLLGRAAALLGAAGDAESAIALYLKSGDWPQASRWIVAAAPTVLAKGRWRTLDAWMEQLPEGAVARDPWLEYWRGMSRIALDPAGAQLALTSAYRNFSRTGNNVGRLVCAAAVSQAIYLESVSFAKLEAWLPILDELLAEQPCFDDAATELLVMAGYLINITFQQASHPQARCTAERILQLLQEPIDVNHRLTAAGALMLFCGYTGWLDGGNRLTATVQPLADLPEVTPLNEAVWHAYAGVWGLVSRQIAWGLAEYEKAIRIATEQNFPFVLTLAYSMKSAMLRETDPAGAEAAMAQCEPLVAKSRPYDVAHYIGNLLYRAFDNGQFEAAVEYGRQTIEYLQGTGGTLFQILIWYMPYGWSLAELGRLDDAAHALARSRVLIERTGTTCYDALHALVSARVARLQGDEPRYRWLLQEGLRRARIDEAARNIAFWLPPRGGAARLLGDALDYGIETETAQKMIREACLAPPRPAPKDWPWPVRIYTLGEFRVLLHGSPLVFGRKLPRKPISLLKAMICLGGRNIPEHQLIDAVWPDEDGDQGYRAFWIALHRLRKLLGSPDHVRLSDGLLSLDESRVWVDALVYAGDPLGDAEVPNGMDRLALYRGSFLPSDVDAPWSISMREKLRSRFVTEVGRMGTALESRGRWDEALGLYERGLEADGLIEEFYQGLMRCHAARGRASAAHAVFRRLGKVLSASLGSSPSAASQALVRAVPAESHESEKHP